MTANQMGNECQSYFTTKKALEIWDNKDVAGQSRMFECLYTVYKTMFFSLVIFEKGSIPKYRLEELAENALLNAWESFNMRGVAGKIQLNSETYVTYFSRIFKNKFIDLYKSELRNTLHRREYEAVYGDSSETGPFENDTTGNAARMKSILDKIGAECERSLRWHYEEKLSHEEIAKRLGIELTSSRQKIWRCRKKFKELYMNSAN